MSVQDVCPNGEPSRKVKQALLVRISATENASLLVLEPVERIRVSVVE